MRTIIYGMSGTDVTLNSLIERLRIAPDNAEWTPKTSVLPLAELEQWMGSGDIEVLGFVNCVIDDGRFRIDPPFPVAEYVTWVKHYYGRCFRENPDSEWADSSYSAGWDLVRKYFADWQFDPLLKAAYEQACLWDVKTPLSE